MSTSFHSDLFLIAEFEPKYRNCRLTNEHAEALTFKTKKQAKAFIMEHIGEGTNSTSQVVAQQVPTDLQVTLVSGNSEVTPMFVEQMARDIQTVTGAVTVGKNLFGNMTFTLSQCKINKNALKKHLNKHFATLVALGFVFGVNPVKS